MGVRVTNVGKGVKLLGISGSCDHQGGVWGHGLSKMKNSPFPFVLGIRGHKGARPCCHHILFCTESRASRKSSMLGVSGLNPFSLPL